MSLHTPETRRSESQFQDTFEQLYPLAYRAIFKMTPEQMTAWGLSEQDLKPIRTAIINQFYPVKFRYEGKEHTFFSDAEVARVMDSFDPMHVLFF